MIKTFLRIMPVLASFEIQVCWRCRICQDWPSSSCKEDANGRRTIDEDGRHSIAKGHLRKATQIPCMQLVGQIVAPLNTLKTLYLLATE